MLDYRMDTFLVLCECMNYRKAAEVLHITQPAVTQQIHCLEREYGSKLFSYENHALTKTEAAVMLEQYARAVKLQERFLRERLTHSQVRELKIGATKTIGDYFLTEDLHRYLLQKENALDLIVDNTDRLLGLLEENKLDFAVVEGFFDKRSLTAFCCDGNPLWVSAAGIIPSPAGRSPSRSCCRRPSSTGRTAPAPGPFWSRS